MLQRLRVAALILIFQGPLRSLPLVLVTWRCLELCWTRLLALTSDVFGVGSLL